MSASSDQHIVATEYVLRTEPFTVRRRVRWSECDPAGVVYAGNFTEYLLSAADLFMQHLKVSGRLMATNDRSYHTPGKAMSLVYMSSLWPDDVFDISVFAGEVRTKTSDVLASASRADNGSAVFMGRITSIYVSREDRRQTVAIPNDVRGAFERYRARHPVPQDLLDAVAR
jgi:acyl-CoA thioesterase FadM